MSNLDSIREHGLLAWRKIESEKIDCKMNSSALSHRLDAAKGLADHIRLSFCRKHPMMFKALKEKRISRPVILEIKLEVVSRPGVLFCDRNAAANGAQTSANPTVIHFDVVRKDYGLVSSEQKSFYQGEVLVPDYVPPHLIRFPKVDAFNKPLAGTELSSGNAKPKLLEVQGAELCGSGSPTPSVTSGTVSSALGVESKLATVAPCAFEKSPLKEAQPARVITGTGGIVAIKADGNCCYHLAGVLGLLCRNPTALSRGQARCLPKDTQSARNQILQNFRSWISTHSELKADELETEVKQTTVILSRTLKFVLVAQQKGKQD